MYQKTTSGNKKKPVVCVYTSAGKSVERVKEKVINNPAPMSSSDSYVIPRSSAISLFSPTPDVCVCALRHLYPPSSFNLPNRNAHKFFSFVFFFSHHEKKMFISPAKDPKKGENKFRDSKQQTNRCATTRRDSVGMANRLAAPLWRHPIAAALPSVVCIDFCFFKDFLVKRTDASSLSFVFFLDQNGPT